MKKIIRLLLLLLILLVLCSGIFLFWSSSAQLRTQENSRLNTNNFDPKINIDSVFTVATYNLSHLNGLGKNKSESDYQKNLKKVKELFQLTNPDIIALQDVDFDAKRSFNIDQSDKIGELGYKYEHEAINWDKNYVPMPYWPPSSHLRDIISGQSILSKYPIENYSRIELAINKSHPFYKRIFYIKRIAQIAEITIDNKLIIVINVHLENIDKSTRDKQFKEVVDLFKEYSKSYPIILLGDFNMTLEEKNSPLKEFMLLKNVGHSKFKKLDHIFFNKSAIDIIDSQVLLEFKNVSSHLPVLMKFRIKYKSLTP